MLFLQKDLQETKKISNFAVNYRTIAMQSIVSIQYINNEKPKKYIQSDSSNRAGSNCVWL